MPFSHSSQLSTIVGYLENLSPKSILDVGTGMGQYGFLARTNLELLNLFEVTGSNARRRDKSEWLVTIDGIEGYPDYVTQVHDYAYNNMYLGDALSILPGLDKQYDMVLAIDILEHFTKAEGFTFLEHLKSVSRHEVLISTPKDFCQQEVEANPLENHRSVWSDADLNSAGFVTTLPNETSWISVYRKT
ncbi:MAG: class I SAM-dependent methyltransferase [Pseudohongiellaceae bacterium]